MKAKHYSGRRSPLPTVGKVFFTLLGGLIVVCVCLLLFFVITEYRPEEETQLTVSGLSGPQTIRAGQSYDLLTFDIGYCGLDASQDSYREGGVRSGAARLENVETNLLAVSELLTDLTPDFAFLQEVDVNSRRSFGVNQLDALVAALPGHTNSFALDHKTPYVPVPVFSPTGRVESGLLSLSSVAVRESIRIRFDGEEAFPLRLFSQSSCFLVTRVAVENGGELVLINVRFSAADDGGAARAAQLAQIKAFLIKELEQGHYIIVGGDWSCQLPDSEYRNFGYIGSMPGWCSNLPEDTVPTGFHWATDSNIPTRRSLDKPYEPSESFAVVTDGFLVSDNIETLSVETLDLDFQNAHHNPVLLSFSLSP